MKISFYCRAMESKPIQGDRVTHNSIADGFENFDIGVEKVAEFINCGYAFTSHHNGRRKVDNFLAAGYIAVDIDRDWRVEEIIALPFVQSFAAIVYTTMSHSPENHRLRVLFELEQEITDPAILRCLATGAIKYFGSDESCKSASQMFYGSKGCNPIVIGRVLQKEQMDMLIQLGESIADKNNVDPSDNITLEHLPEGTKNRLKKSENEPKRSAIALVKDQMVMLTNRSYHSLAGLKVLSSVFCPFHGDSNASAFVVKNRSGVNGVHCRACNTSYWPEGHTRQTLLEYDFFSYERHIDKLEYEEDPMHLDNDAPVEFFNNDLRQVQRRNQKYLTDIPLQKGIIGLASPTGSGKSALLKKIVEECRATYKTVLVIGHRTLLLGELARSLGLHFYKDKNKDSISAPPYFAICIDSMPSLLNTAREKYDVVIIDESEQVFRHLIAKTLAKNRRQCYFQMEFFLKNAQSVILSDADLGFLTIKSIERMIGQSRNTKLYVNSYKPTSASIDLYDSKNHLIVDMKNSVLAGGRHYICCNSKTTALLMKKILVYAGMKEEKIMLITSDNSHEKEIVDFLKCIKTAILDFDVLIASPSLGTGIDITFNDAAQLIDTTFGFFDAGITTHFDLDQQLARVRHPKAVKAWISPQIAYVETDPTIIKDYCITSGEMTDALTGYDATGHPMYGANDKILTLYADVTSMSNASKNNLKKHFIDLKLHNGWNVNYVTKEESGQKEISEEIGKAKASIDTEKMLALMNAKDLSESEFNILINKNNMRRHEILSVQKFSIKKFYGEDVTTELLKLDNKGVFRRQLRMMALFMSNPFTLAERDARRNERLSIDRENNSLKSELLKELLPVTGITDVHGNFNLNLEITTVELDEFTSICLRKIHAIKTLLEVDVRSDIRKKPMSQLTTILQVIGMRMKNTRHSDDKNGKRIFYYKVDLESHNLVMQYLPLVKKGEDFETKLRDVAQKEKERKARKQEKNIHR